MTEVINKNGIPFDIDAIATDLNNKMDRDGLNSIASVCVESYQNGTSGYRVYSDGYCEQWGYTPKTSDAYISVSFFKAFNDANPNVQFTRRFYYDNDTTTPQNRTTGISSVSATGFKCYDNAWSGSGGSAGMWRACGYIN